MPAAYALSAPGSLQRGRRVEVRATPELTPAWLASLAALPSHGTHLSLALQLLTMDKEAPAAHGHATHFAALFDGGGGAPVAAAVFRPRADAALVELLVSCRPGEGHGGALLEAVEADCRRR
jgi:hypothetical protein